jgi:transposase-like protein
MAARLESLDDLKRLFGTNEVCAELLSRLRWPDGFRCGRCGSTNAWYARRGLYRCSSCDRQTSVTAGTLLQGTRKPLTAWFRAMWHVATEPDGISALEIQRILGLGSYRTAWTWLHKLRRAMVAPQDRLGGIVAVDEDYVGADLGGDRRRGGVAESLVFAAVTYRQGRPGQIRLCRVPDRTKASLHAAILQSVALGTLIHSGPEDGYEGLRLYGYRHQAIPRAATGRREPLPLVAQVLDSLNAWLLATPRGAVRPSHLDFYLDEFSFRYNHRRLRRSTAFYRLLSQAVRARPVRDDDLHGRTVPLLRSQVRRESKAHRYPFFSLGGVPPKPPQIRSL